MYNQTFEMLYNYILKKRDKAILHKEIKIAFI